MSTREMTEQQFEDFPDDMQDMVIFIKKALKEYSKKHEGLDFTIAIAGMAAVANDLCKYALSEHGNKVNYKEHAIGVFKAIITDL